MVLSNARGGGEGCEADEGALTDRMHGCSGGTSVRSRSNEIREVDFSSIKISGLKPEVATPSNIWRTILVNSIRVVIHLKYLEDRGHGIVTARGSRLVAANRAAIDSFLSSRATNL